MIDKGGGAEIFHLEFDLRKHVKNINGLNPHKYETIPSYPFKVTKRCPRQIQKVI